MMVNGFVEMGNSETIKRVVLNSAATVGRHCAAAFRALIKAEHLAVILG